MTTNPFAALDDRAAWDDMPDEERAVVVDFGAMEEHDAAVRPDPAYVAHERELLTLLATIYGAANVAQAVDDAAEEHGGLLMKRPTLWPVESCGDLSGLAADLYADGAQ